MSTLNRRTVLRGMFGGTALTLGLPLLDCFLDTNGEALADGSPLPVNFVSWFQGLGFAPGYWEPKNVGPGYDFGVQLKALAPMKDKINIFSGLKVFLDSHPAGAHSAGPQGCLQGGVSTPNLPSIDQIIADHIGTRTPFRSIEVSCEGSQDSLSRRSATAINPSEPSPLALYARLFGATFKDPNAGEFSPDPVILARKSILSVMSEQRSGIDKQLGTSDRIRLDEYYTSMREIEKRLELQTQKPDPLPSCKIPNDITEQARPGMLIDDVRANNAIHAKLIAHAFACGQSRVASVNFGDSLSNIRRAGSQQTFHMYTHEEQIDPVLGYQKEVAWFSNQVAESLLEFVTALASVKEGGKTLLDRSLIMYSTDSGYARSHSVENMPVMTIGSANGKLKTGIHVKMSGDSVTRAGLTVMQALGVPVGSWGVESNTTTKTITEVMA